MHSSPIDELIETLTASKAIEADIYRAGDLILTALRTGRKVLSCGNGGSAADALHLAEELVGRYRSNRPPLPAVCLNADPTALTCIGNDFGYEQVFARQVEALGQPGDVLVGFTTSGHSPNVLAAFQAARARGLQVILAGGKDGGKARALADLSLIVPATNNARIQEVHTLFLHAWLEQVEAEDWSERPLTPR